MAPLSISVRFRIISFGLLIGFAIAGVAGIRPTLAADVEVAAMGVIDFFCPELAYYRQQLENAGLASREEVLREYLESVNKQIRDSADEGARIRLNDEQMKLLRAVLYMIAADEVPHLTTPILEALVAIDDPLIQVAAEQALAGTVGARDIDQIKRAIEPGKPEHVRASCIRVLGRLRPKELEKLLTEILEDARSDHIEFVTAVALAQYGQPAALDSLLSLLSSSRSRTRRQAARMLRQWTSQDFGFNTHRTEKERAYAIKRWRGWYSSLDVNTLKPLPRRRPLSVLAVRGKELFELGPDGELIHKRIGFNSLSEAIGLGDGKRLVTDFMGRMNIEYDKKWNELKRHPVPFQPRGSHRLSDGRTLVIGMSRFQFFDADGAEIDKPMNFAGDTNFTGSQLVGGDSFLVTCNDSGLIRELSFSGEILWKMQAENHPRSVQVLDDGRLLAADFRQAVIYTEDGEAVWRHKLDHVHSAHQLPSHNILLGHSAGLSVISPAGDVLWEMKQLPVGGSGFFAQLEWMHETPMD